MRPNLEALRDLGPVGVLVRSGAKPSSRKGRYSPCPMCGAPDVQVGRVVWTCHRCGVSLDAPATAKALGGGTWEGAMVWAGVDTSGPWVAPARPLVLDWRPFWPDAHWVDLLPIASLDTPDLSIRAREAARRPGTDHVRAARGLEAVAGREAVGMVWDSLLDWRAHD